MGLVGPKTRPKGVADGQQVNIPVLGSICLTYGKTEFGNLGLCNECRFKCLGSDRMVKTFLAET